MLMSHKIPLLTFTLVCTWYEESTPWGDLIPEITEKTHNQPRDIHFN